jgi:hypothetical protein
LPSPMPKRRLPARTTRSVAVTVGASPTPFNNTLAPTLSGSLTVSIGRCDRNPEENRGAR